MTQNSEHYLFLGLRENVPVDNLETLETRFGIEIKNLPIQSATVTIQPKPAFECRVVVRGEDNLPPATFPAEFFVPPEIMAGVERRIHLKSYLFYIDLFMSGSGVRPRFRFDISSKRASSDAWWNFWRMLRIFSDKRGQVEITSKKMEETMRIDIRRADEMESYNFEPHVQVCESLSRIFKYIDSDLTPEFDWASVEAQVSHIAFLDQIIQGSSISMSIPIDPTDTHDQLAGKRIIVASELSIADQCVSYYSLATMSVENNASNDRVRISDLVFRRGLLMEKSEEKFLEFVEEARRREGIEWYLALQPEL